VGQGRQLRPLATISGWVVAAMCLYLARYSIGLAAEASAEHRECLVMSCELMTTQARLLGWTLAPDCGAIGKTPGVWSIRE